MGKATIYLFPGTDEATLSEVGGKGLSLMIGSRNGFPVPPGFVLAASFFTPWWSELKATKAWTSFVKAKEKNLKTACQNLKKQAGRLSFTREQKSDISAHIARFSGKTFFTVRSSSPEEDLEGSSFAGGYETVLGVSANHMERAVKKAFASCLDYRVTVYKRKNGFDVTDPKIAVVVQEQIASDAAGVGFSLNPVTNSYDEAVLNANRGLGESVVSGRVTPDTYVVNTASEKIVSRSLGAKELSVWLLKTGGTKEKTGYRSRKFVLSKSQVLELAKLIKKVEQSYGKPMDIEWAYAKKNLYLLQARPISVYVPLSSEMKTLPGERKRLYADVTISVQGIDRPLSVIGTSFFFSVLKKLQKVILLRDATRRIDRALPWIENGRLYANLSNILRLFGKKRVSRFFQMTDSLLSQTIASVDEKEYLSRTNRLLLLPFGILPFLPKVIFYVRRAKKDPARMHRECQAHLANFTKTVRAVARNEPSLRKLSEKLIRLIGTDILLKTGPLFMLGKRAFLRMKKLAGKKLGEELEPLRTALPNNMTTEMGFALYRVSKLLPRNLDLEALETGIKKNSLPKPFLTAWKGFLKKYGHRGTLEIDIGAPKYHDNPRLLLSTLLSMSDTKKTDDPEARWLKTREENRNIYLRVLEKIREQNASRAKRFESYYTVFETFAGYRETHKYYLSLITFLLRSRILQEGKRLKKAGRLKSAEQAFDLTFEDFERAEKDSSFDLVARAKKNRTFPDRLAALPELPAVIDSRGLILRPPASRVRPGETVGMPISPGVIRGRIKVLHTPDEKILRKGEILVARMTDPGWTPLFVNAAAVILEVGGSLQHGALVAREYGLPCVAGVQNATKLWEDGVLVEVDGAEGRVRVVR